MELKLTEQEAIELTIEYGFDGSEFDTKMWEDRGCLKPNHGTQKGLVEKLETIYNKVSFEGRGKKRVYILEDKKEEQTERVFNYKGTVGKRFSKKHSKKHIENNKLKSSEEYDKSKVTILHPFLLMNNAQYYVYRFVDRYEQVIYVGQTINLASRMHQHFNNGHLSEKVYNEVSRVEYQILLSQVEMDIMELYYINKWKPKYNVRSQNDERMSITIENNNRWYEYKKERYN